MKAIVYSKYGTPMVLALKEIEKPVPKDNEVLVKIHASTVTPMDYRFRSGNTFIARFLMTGLIKPKIHVLGVEFSGVVEETGKNVTHFKARDKVFGRAKKGGGHAEYICVSEKEIAINPPKTTFEEAAGITFGATTALRFLRDCGKI